VKVASYINITSPEVLVAFLEEASHRALWRTRFERGYGPVVRQCDDNDDDLFK
jgi:hypothetical protein